MLAASLSSASLARPRVTAQTRNKSQEGIVVRSSKVALKKTQPPRRRVQIVAMAKPEKGSRPTTDVLAANPNATVDGKLWVCQGCGYVYDGTKGPWAEDKRCPACGERRFALKSRDEMAVAIGGLIACVLLIGSLFLIVKL
mmetsp:Transcript_3309/g.10168  ORF Transcript_3309/g.10168 Transcript_3309/m.10168 type:complete len:141 (-) Transcript_3309:125-547(-)